MSDYSAYVLAQSPVCYYRLGEAPGATSAVDATGNGRTGTYQASPTLGTKGAITGDPDTAMGPLNGTSQFVQIAANAALNLADVFTIIGWIIPGVTGAQRILMSKGTNAYQLLLGSNNQLAGATQSGGIFVQATAIPTVLASVYSQVALTKNAGVSALYVNGLAVTTTNPNAVTATNSTDPLCIGVDFNAGSFANCTFDEFALYGTAFSPSAILTDYEVGIRDTTYTSIAQRLRNPLNIH